ncbi:D-xylose transport system permease protein [Pararobbsia alpina]|uniref:sugar ABC transporter permease n=1 Tax=Pararobbsia alpina TaxID=621374 RepID=UPI0039A63862
MMNEAHGAPQGSSGNASGGPSSSSPNPSSGAQRDTQGNAQPSTQLDRSDVRVKHSAGVGDSISAFIGRVKSGDLGSLPVVVGLVIIWTVFTVLNPVFLSANNLVNLLFDCSTVGVISLGIVCVLLVGEIDLSVGSMSGFASALVGTLWVNSGWPVLLAILFAIVVGAVVGAVYALLLTKLGMPSFVATLAGLLAILGMQLYVLGSTGSINLPYGAALVNLGQLMIIPAVVSYILALLPGLIILLSGIRTGQRRRAVNLSAASLGSIVVRALVLTVFLEVVVAYLNQGRGVPLMFGLFLGLAVAMNYALTKTRWGRSMNAVGGNHEAARRAGIKVNAIYTSAFVLCASFAALGGVLTAARLASASQQAGTGDVNLNAIAAAVIGGTSLFGGRGSAYSAVLGIIVIQSIASGLTLLNLSSSLRFMITGAVLAIAVIVDSLARRSRVSHGRA